MKDIKYKILTPIFKKYRISKAAVFGSRARGEEKEESDLDLLVDLRGKTTLFDLAALQLDLEDILGIKVDLVTYRSLDKKLKPFILRDAKRIL